MKTAIRAWLLDEPSWDASVSRSQNSSRLDASEAFISQCFGASCGDSCGDITKAALQATSWVDALAIATLSAVGLMYLLLFVVFGLVLWKAALFRRKIQWYDAHIKKHAILSSQISPNGEHLRKVLSNVAVIPQADRIRVAALNLWFYPSQESVYTSSPILKGVDFEAEPGELVAIMGGSGCGKSTLLDIVCGRKTYGFISGQLLVNEAPLQSLHFGEQRKALGYVRQTGGNYLPFLSVFDNMMYAALLRLPMEMDGETRKQTVLQVLSEVGLEGTLGTPAGSEDSFANIVGISGGQRRRLAIAIELLGTPKALFLDEPTSGLDASTSLQLLQLLNLLAGKGRVVVLSIHQPRLEIFRMFHKVCVMDKGTIVIMDSPPAVVKAFLDVSSRLNGAIDSSKLLLNVADLLMDMMMDKDSTVRGEVARDFVASHESELLQRFKDYIVKLHKQASTRHQSYESLHIRPSFSSSSAELPMLKGLTFPTS